MNECRRAGQSSVKEWSRVRGGRVSGCINSWSLSARSRWFSTDSNVWHAAAHCIVGQKYSPLWRLQSHWDFNGADFLLFAAVVISFVFLWHYSFTTLLLKANISNPSLKHYPPILKSTKAVWIDLCCGALCTSADEGSTGWWHAAYSFLHVGWFVIGSIKV